MLYADRDECVVVGPSWQPIAPGVRVVKCQLPTVDSTILNVVFDPRSKLPTHRHEDREESIYVVEGEIIDEERNVRFFSNELYVIPAGVNHSIYSPNGARLNVIFRPKYPDDKVEAK
jgi:mannose-6-phosphate isomerase-like protein (cupin superfamily)